MQMNSVSKATLCVALALAGVAAAFTAASAQNSVASVSLNRAERQALQAVQVAFNSGNYPAATAALAAARSVASSPDARLYVAQYQYQVAVQTSDQRGQIDALETLIASGRLPAGNVAALHGQIGTIAYNNLRDYARAERAFSAQAAAAPNSTQALTNLARVKRDLKKPQEALPLLARAIALQRAAGQIVPESWYKMGLDIAVTAKNAPQAAVIGRDFVASYPTAQNWRDVLLTQRELQAPDMAAALDLYRLMRATKSLGGERDYLEMAKALETAGFPAEAKAVIEEGISARMVEAGKGGARDFLTRSNARIAQERSSLAGLQTRALADGSGTLALKAADTLFSHGEYAKAATLYRAAAQKGSVDANLANSRLGMALALAGQRSEAEAALRAVTGPRADIAGYWLAWVARQA